METKIFDEAGGAAYMKAKAYLQLAEPFAEMRADIDLIKRGKLHKRVSSEERLELDKRLLKAFANLDAYAFFFDKPAIAEELSAEESGSLAARLCDLSEKFYDLRDRSDTDQAKWSGAQALIVMCGDWLKEENRLSRELAKLLKEE